MSDTYPALNYPWQKAVLDVFREFDSEGLPIKINLAERAIAERLGDGTPVEQPEHTAIADAQRALQFLFPKRLGSREGSRRFRSRIRCQRRNAKVLAGI